MISAHGVRPNTSKIEKTLNNLTPQHVTYIRQFLGLATNHHQSMADFEGGCTYAPDDKSVQLQ